MIKKLINKRVLIILFIIIVFLICFVVIMIKQNTKYKKSKLINVNSKLYPCSNLLVEITPNGTIYEHDFSGKPKKVSENSNIIFTKNTYLLIKKDGGIYLDNKDDYIGEKIAQIDNAATGSYSLTHLAVVTSTGELYVSSMNKIYDENYYKGNIPTDLSLVKDIPKVKKVVCGDECTFFLTVDGEVYGYFKGINNNQYKKIDIKNSIKDIDGWHKTFVALDENDNVYEIGNSNFSFTGGGGFGAREKFMDITAIATSDNPGFILNQNGNVKYWGCHNEGKAADVSYSGKIKDIKNVDKIYYYNSSLYLIKKNTVIKVNVDDLK